MISIGKVRLKCGDLLGIKSSKEAFLSSKITSDWHNTDDLFKIVSTLMTREEFDLIISNFVLRGAVETDSILKALPFEINDGRDFRDYGTIKFDHIELSEAPQLPENMKKEILFLYYYGKNISYYKILNIPELFNASHEKVIKRCNCYRQLLAGKNFEGLDIGSYNHKIQKVREVIKTASQLEDADIRQKYDAFLKTTTTAKAEKTEKKEHTRTNADVANEHFMLSIKYHHLHDIKKAYNEILIAMHLDPDNMELSSFKNELSENLKIERTDNLFNALEKNDFLLLDESKLEAVISNILELTESSPLTHLKLAEIALEKDMPEMAIQHAIEAVNKDPDLKNKVTEILNKAQNKKREFDPVPEHGPKTFHISKDNLARKN